MNWQGDNPVFLIIAPDDGDGEIIDLDERGWLTRFSSLLRLPGNWYLVIKTPDDPGRVVLQMRVQEGEQPYYTARHVGIASAAGVTKAEITAYGIGKKRTDGHVDRIWLLPDGSVCGGDDVESVSLAMIKRGG